MHLMRYKLDEFGFHYDDFLAQVPGAGWESEFRSEMELIKLANGNYRIAIPTGQMPCRVFME